MQTITRLFEILGSVSTAHSTHRLTHRLVLQDSLVETPEACINETDSATNSINK